MNLPRQKRDETSATIAQTLWLIVLCSGLFVATTYASDPSWWSSVGTGTQSAVICPPQVVTNGDVVSTNYIPNNYAVVTQGQLKHFTARAVDELNTALTNGAGTALITMVSNWASDYATNGYATNTNNPTMPYKPSDLQAENVGQLKYVAGLVYAQLAAAGYTGLYPSWIEQNTNTDGAVANLGQLKEVFDFDLSVAPGAVTDLVATTNNPDEIDLSWTLPAMNDAQSLLVEESTDGGTDWTTVATLDPTTTTYAATGLDPTQSYIYQVVASNTSGSTSSGATTATQPVPASPVPLTGSIDGSDNMNLSWAASTGASNYLVERETIASGSWSTLATTSGTSYEDTGHDPGGFRYRVSALNSAGGASAASNVFPPVRYVVIDLGANMNPTKVTNSGYVLIPVSGTSSSYSSYVWYNGTLSSAFTPVSPGDFLLPYDISESGEVVGQESLPQALAYWSSRPLNPELATWSSPMTEATPSLTQGPVDIYGDSFYVGVAIDTAGTIWSLKATPGAVTGTIYSDDEWSAQISTPDGYEDSTELGSLMEEYDDAYYDYYGTQVWPGAVNAQGDALTGQSYYDGLGEYGLPNIIFYGAYMNDQLLDFSPTGISNEISGNVYVVGTSYVEDEAPLSLGEGGTLWSSSNDTTQSLSVPDPYEFGYSLSVNAATCTTNNTPAIEVVSSPWGDYASYLFEMDPASGEMGSPRNLSDLLPDGCGWSGFTAGYGAWDNPPLEYEPPFIFPRTSVINDYGAIVGTATKSSDGSTHGIMLVPAYQIQVDAFIPQQWVSDPLGYVYNGNSRKTPLDGSFTTGTTTFTNTSPEFKIEQKVMATVLNNVDPGGTQEANSLTTTIGQTRKYYSSAVVGGLLSPTATPFETQTAVPQTATVTITHPSNNVVTVELVGKASNPLISPIPYAPPIYYDITVKIDATTTPPTYTLSGNHKLFPAYEVYINKQLIHDYSPIPGGDTPRALFISPPSLSDSSITGGCATDPSLTGTITNSP